MPQETEIYQSTNKIRIVTAASLFDGHDAAINIMRRIMQSSGAEIIHLGHDRSVEEIVNCAIQEDVQAIAITSYQGGHNEYFKYMYDLLNEKGCGHIKLFGGGGGVILPEEIKDLMDYGIARIYSPDDGRELGLQGMINDVLRQSDFPTLLPELNGQVSHITDKNPRHIASLITSIENDASYETDLLNVLQPIAEASKTPVLGITGTGGAGKSTSVDEFVRRFLDTYPEKSIAIISVDPTKRKSGGALLGDRIRMNAINSPRVFMRSMATREANLSMSKSVNDALTILKAAEYDLIILESSGIGQSGSEIIDYSDVSLYVMTPEYGAASQLEKIDMLDFADVIALNKFDKRGGLDALRDVKKQYQRNHGLWETDTDSMPVFGTIASQFNDPGTNQLFSSIMNLLAVKAEADFEIKDAVGLEQSEKNFIIPPKRVRYLSEIADSNRKYDQWVEEQSEYAQKLYALNLVMQITPPKNPPLEGGTQSLTPPSRGDKRGVGIPMDYRTTHSGATYNASYNKPSMKENRKALRENATKEEKILWEYLKKKQLGYKIRRQHSIEGFVVDFFNTKKGLVIEIDGGYHNHPNQQELDNERQEFLEELGLKVIRFTNEEVDSSAEVVAQSIKSKLDSLPDFEGDYTRSSSETRNQNESNSLMDLFKEYQRKISVEVLQAIENWDETVKRYKADEYVFEVRGMEIRIPTHTESLSKTHIPKIALPKYEAWGDLTKWIFQENVPGEFPFTAGVYPFKRTGEDPTRMFAGEGGPERTNKRFHYVSLEQPAKRLSTAFDSVTLYGHDPDYRPDIYGKIGNAGVSIWSLDAMKKLYSGFELTNPKTSVSMTINGPAATIMAFFLNTAIDQECEKYIKENGLGEEVEQKIKTIYSGKGIHVPTYQGQLPEGNDGLGLLLLGISGDQVLPKDVYDDIKAKTISQVRGTVQADILKEDQAQNTCIFSTDFSLKLMGDVQQYFIDHNVRNFYSVSISGYHIAEAGANPITQLALTLANGFTYVEYYLSRGMDINKFAPNLSFFFSNGIDPEYAVIGRVARRIWAKAMREKYGANKRSQMLKYHIQTSGRSLHAQEIQFNDIRTTLQALYAIYDNCNSLHTNAYDEAITTPTEESVRRAMAIQLIINKELGLAKNENPMQGSFIIEELTDLVEEAVLLEFDRITERGGVLGAMETMYQRGKIQEESMYYEWKKHTGEYPIIGVNTFLGSDGSPTTIANEVIRSTEEEKEYQIKAMKDMHELHQEKAAQELLELKQVALENGNLFEKLMESVKYCTLGQITYALFDVGGKYRRNM